MAVTLTQVRAFLAVKHSGSVRAAAGQLLVSQPTVSAAIAALARELGVGLFERQGRGVRPTEAGEAFAPYAAALLGILEQGQAAAQEAARPGNSVIRLVCVNTAGEYLVPPLIQAYRQQHAGVRVMLEVGNRATVLERLESRRADIGIGGRPPGGRLRGFRWLDNQLVVVGRDRPADLAAIPWLLRGEGSGTRLHPRRTASWFPLARQSARRGRHGPPGRSGRDTLAAARRGIGDAARHRAAADGPRPGLARTTHPRLERRDQAGSGDRPWRDAHLRPRGGTRAERRAAGPDSGRRNATEAPVACTFPGRRPAPARCAGLQRIPPLGYCARNHRKFAMRDS